MTFRTSRVLGAIALLATVTPALAQQQDSTTPYYVGVNGGYTHLSNVFRQDGGTNSDNVLSASLLGGVDLRLGRQHLRADGSLTSARYSRNSELNNSGYNGQLALDWSTIERLQGTITVSGSEQLADYNIASYLAPVYTKNTVKNYYADAVTYLGLVTRWSLMVDANYHKLDYSAPQYAILNYEQRSWAVGPSWQPNPDLRVGMAWRQTSGDYPTYFHDTVTGAYGANDFRRRDLDLTVSWRSTGHNSFDGRLSTGRYPGADTSGQTRNVHSGALTWRYEPTGKLVFLTSYVHDQGLSSFFYAGLGSSLNQNSKTESLQFQPSYQLTGKITLNASAAYTRTSQDSEVLGTAIGAYHDTTRSLTFGASYAYSRSISANCQASRQVRDSNLAGYSYAANTIGCNAQMLFF
ncbi:MAG: outer membrane beta-barrel protein [Paucibacter sp.]|nr:outer membrane beta-barrel protein [Roseateles sp.]